MHILQVYNNEDTTKIRLFNSHILDVDDGVIRQVISESTGVTLVTYIQKKGI